MNAAHAFTGCKKTGDRLIRFNVENGCLNVDGDAAHAVMNLRAHF